MLAAIASRLAPARGRAARAASAMITGTLLVGVLAAPTLAATPPLTMDVAVGNPCVTGFAKPNTVIKDVIKDSTGAVVARDAMMSRSDGSWEACVGFSSDVIATGYQIKIFDYDTNQNLRYTIPRITLDVNRVTDVVSGKAPAGMNLALEAADSSGPLFGRDPYDVITNVSANGSGAYSHDFSADGIDLMAGAALEVRTVAAGGRITARRDLTVPGIFVVLGHADMQGYISPYHHLGATLTDHGSQVATGDAVGDDFGQFRSKFIDADGVPYAIHGGETLSAPELGISWTIPSINGTANKATDKVSGTCFSNSPWIVETSNFAFANGITGGSGNFTVDLSRQSDVRKGTEVLIACATQAGDFVEQDFIVQ